MEEWPTLQSLPLTWNKSWLQVMSYCCNLLYLKQSHHSHWKIANRERIKELEMRQTANTWPKLEATNGGQLIRYFHSCRPSPLPFRLWKPVPFPVSTISFLFWTVRPTQTPGSLLLPLFKIGTQSLKWQKTIFKTIYLHMLSKLTVYISKCWLVSMRLTIKNTVMLILSGWDSTESLPETFVS